MAVAAALSCLQVIASSTADAECKQKAAQEKEEALQVESVQIAVDKEAAERALTEAIPALEDAAAALNDLKRDDITEIRSFAKPHVLVQRVRGGGGNGARPCRPCCAPCRPRANTPPPQCAMRARPRRCASASSSSKT